MEISLWGDILNIKSNEPFKNYGLSYYHTTGLPDFEFYNYFDQDNYKKLMRQIFTIFPKEPILAEKNWKKSLNVINDGVFANGDIKGLCTINEVKQDSIVIDFDKDLSKITEKSFTMDKSYKKSSERQYELVSVYGFVEVMANTGWPIAGKLTRNISGTKKEKKSWKVNAETTISFQSMKL